MYPTLWRHFFKCFLLQKILNCFSFASFENKRTTDKNIIAVVSYRQQESRLNFF